MNGKREFEGLKENKRRFAMLDCLAQGEDTQSNLTAGWILPAGGLVVATQGLAAATQRPTGSNGDPAFHPHRNHRVLHLHLRHHHHNHRARRRFGRLNLLREPSRC